MISVVSGTFNRLPLLMKMVASARAALPASFPLEFIIVDGGSDDGTQAWCKTQPDATLIEHGELRGAIPAFTEGAYAAQGRFVILANDDIQFRGSSIFKALLYLETRLTCGAVAFADNRPSPPRKTNRDYMVMPMAARRRGRDVSVAYAQVGMYRRWLGDKCGWWGANDPNFNARTYGGDNYLSSRIWELGYSVDAVQGVEVDDAIADDGLRQIGFAIGNADSEQYFARFPTGADIPEAALVPQQDAERLRILYLPVYEPGHTIQKLSKRGLRDALAKRAWVYEFDFLMYQGEHLYAEMAKIMGQFKPHMLISQIQAHEPLNATLVQRIRALDPRMVWVNWNGDYAPGGLTHPSMLALLQWVDLQLCINGSVLDTYKQHGIAAAYWQIGYEEPGDELPDVKHHDVVFLANAYLPGRKALEPVLKSTGADVGLYGSGWDSSAGFNLYDFATGKAIYGQARIAIGDNQFPDAYGFVSNRIFQAMAAGGCLLLHQYVPGLEELTGLKHNIHYVVWVDHQDLKEKLRYYLHPDNEAERLYIADAGTAFVREHHSFDARVKELFELLKTSSKRRPREMITVIYTGARKTEFGVAGYGQYTPGDPLRLPADEAAMLLRQPELWKKVESEF